MLVQKQVGPVTTTSSLAAGAAINGRLGNMGEDIVSELHGRYYETTYRRAMFTGATQAVVATATAVGPVAATTGVPVLYNPIGNINNVVLTKVAVGFILAPAAPLVYGIATGYNGSTAVSGTLTSVTPKNRFIGLGATPTAQMYFSAASTLPTAPTADIILGAVDTGAVTTAPAGAFNLYDLEGSIILPPGGYACIYTSAAMVASSLLASFQWEEVPL